MDLDMGYYSDNYIDYNTEILRKNEDDVGDQVNETDIEAIKVVIDTRDLQRCKPSVSFYDDLIHDRKRKADIHLDATMTRDEIEKSCELMVQENKRQVLSKSQNAQPKYEHIMYGNGFHPTKQIQRGETPTQPPTSLAPVPTTLPAVLTVSATPVLVLPPPIDLMQIADNLVANNLASALGNLGV